MLVVFSMQFQFYVITVGTWFVFMVLAIVNAVVRNSVYRPVVGELVAHQISTVVFIGLILITTFLVFRFSRFELSDSEALLMGGLWLTGTILFEFVAGYFVFGNSWEHLFADYNLLKGRVWSLVLVTTFFAPFIVNKF